MDADDLSKSELQSLAKKVASELPTGTHGDRVVLSRRQFAAAATGTLGAGALMALGVDEASAQAAGQQGTASSPNDMYAYDLWLENQLQNDFDAGGNALTNVGSVSAEEATIGGEALNRVPQLLDQQLIDLESIDMDVSVPSDTILLLEYALDSRDGAQIDVTINNNTTNNYQNSYFNSANVSDSDRFRLNLSTSTSNAQMTGSYKISGASAGIRSTIHGSGTQTGSTFDGVLVEGLLDDTAPIESVQVTSTNTFDNGYVRLYQLATV